MLSLMFTSSPSCASLTGGYLHLAPFGAKTYSIINQLNECILTKQRDAV